MAEERDPNQNEEVKIDELDEKDLEDASGGGGFNLDQPVEGGSNSGCNCGCS
jgi:hypothetical protein